MNKSAIPTPRQFISLNITNMSQIFIDGIRVDEPSEKAPDFVKGKISINLEKFIESARQHVSPKGWITLDIKVSQKGGWYTSLNEWKPLEKPEFMKEKENDGLNSDGTAMPNFDKPDDDINADDIPF